MAPKEKTAGLYYILAPAYHGATHLSARLNFHPDIFSLGTGNPVLSEDPICACGEAVSSCPFWKSAAHAIGHEPDSPLKTLLPQCPFISRNETLNRWINAIIALAANETGPKRWKMMYEAAERFFGIHEKFHSHNQLWAPHKIFVDAERSLLKFMVMASMDFPVKGVIHLVRDPRGYAASWKKYYPESTPEKFGLEWAAAHTRIRRLGGVYTKVPFLTVRYEDLVAQPYESYGKCLDFLGLYRSPEERPVPDGRKNHMLGLGRVEGLEDVAPAAENWRESLSAGDQERVVRAAGAVFSELGYKR